jgi:hypothetical protein
VLADEWPLAGRRRVQVSKKASFPEGLGFRDGAASVHTSRTMMLEELSLLLGRVRSDAPAAAYVSVIVEENVLAKPTQTTRQRTAKRLRELYALDPGCALFRLLRHFWDTDPASKPMLAFLAAAARDPLLRETTPFVQDVPPGDPVTPEQIAAHLNEKYPKRFQASTALATAQRLASSLGQAGYLRGRAKKTRSRPQVTPIVAAFALILGYLCGLRGKLLLGSSWTGLLDRSPAEVAELAAEASKQGWLTFKAAGAVVEITFPGLLKPHEEKAAHDPD